MAKPPIDVAAFLESHRDDILATARHNVGRAELTDYEAAGEEAVEERIARLFDLVVSSARVHDIGAVVTYAEGLGRARRRAGYELGQVQTVINVLEEAIWRALAADIPADELGYALGIVSTVLGAAKDRLACAYVAAAGSPGVRSLRLDELFDGNYRTI